MGGIFLFSLIIKLKGLENFSGENVLSGFDAFWYARLSKEILNGNYLGIDYLRDVPDFSINSYPPPLISLLPVWLSNITGIKLETFFVLIPPITSILFIFPLYFWLKRFAPVHVFIGGAILGIFNLIYFNRTMLGRFDTDSLILFFVFLIFIFITKAVYDREKSYFWIVVSSIIFNLFMWWYNKPIFSFFFLLSLLLGFLINKENLKSILYKVSLFILLTNPLFLIDSIRRYIKGYIDVYVLKQSSQIIPISLMANITELMPIDFNQLIAYTTDNIYTVILSFIGLFLFFYKNFRYMIISLPILIIGITSFWAGNRFVMYLAPFIGMGLGYIFYLLYEIGVKRYSNFKNIFYVFSLFLVLFFSFPAQRIYADPKPLLKNKIWEDFKIVKSSLKENAYLWSWWDYGYILSYALNKGVYVDNGNFNPIKNYFFAHSIIIDDENKSRNLIAFITNNLYKDYGLNLKSLKDTWLLKDKAYLYDKPLKQPVYVVLFGDIMQKSIIHNLGTFGLNLYDKDVASVSVFEKCDNKIGFYDCGLFKLQKENEELTWARQSLKNNPPYKEVIFINRDNSTRKVIYQNENYPYDRMLEIIKDRNELYILIGNRKIKNSILNRMLIFKDSFTNFKIVFDDFPDLVIYEVLK
ncbi:STT3 domain-containing protein [Venenivibrio stagnispumantis]|uniref:STT3 domain-containing protein n=1 Tax=Venenivibrio stagnispumantis TaxID=407998 RepID=UPI0024BB1FE5|nr:STT3 domain-containing protein [Venenivibrio stagnispumantis]